MSKAKRGSTPDVTPLLIVIDRSHPTDVNAAWFKRADAKAVRQIARRHKLDIWSGDPFAVAELAQRLLEGRIDGEALSLPAVNAELGDELRRLVTPNPPAFPSQGSDDEENFADDLEAAERDGLSPALNPDQALVDADMPQAPMADTGAPLDNRMTSIGSEDTGQTSSSTAGLRSNEVQRHNFDLRTGPSGGDGIAETDESQAKPVVLEFADALPLFWQHLAPGTLVLAADLDKKGEPECWYEAIVVRRTPDAFILRWRDFPRDGLLSRTPRHVGLLRPVT